MNYQAEHLLAVRQQALKVYDEPTTVSRGDQEIITHHYKNAMGPVHRGQKISDQTLEKRLLLVPSVKREQDALDLVLRQIKNSFHPVPAE